MVALLIPNQLVRVQILGDVLFRIDNIVLWSNGDDTCFTCRKRWFDSIKDYCQHHGEAGLQSSKEKEDVEKYEVRPM